jgi:hypothetical protein
LERAAAGPRLRLRRQRSSRSILSFHSGLLARNTAAHVETAVPPKPENETRALSEPAFADQFVSAGPVPAARRDEAAEKSREFALSKLQKNEHYQCVKSWRRKQSLANRSPPVGSLFHGENTGKFADFGLEIAKAPRLLEENSIAYQQNSLVAKAGKICRRSGKPEAGNSESDPNNRVSRVGSGSFKSTTIWNEHSARNPVAP